MKMDMQRNSGLWWPYPFLPLLLLSPLHAEVDITRDGEGVTTFWYNSSNTQVATFLFNYCTLNSCNRFVYAWGCNPAWNPKNKGLTAYICVTSKHWGNNCNYWGSVGWNTGPSWGYEPQEASGKRDKNGESLLTRMTLVKSSPCNDRHVLSIRHPQPGDGGHYVLGSYGLWGTSRITFFIKDMYKNSEYTTRIPSTPVNPLKPHFSTFKDMMAISDPTYEDVVTIETGASELNLWLE